MAAEPAGPEQTTNRALVLVGLAFGNVGHELSVLMAERQLPLEVRAPLELAGAHLEAAREALERARARLPRESR